MYPTVYGLLTSGQDRRSVSGQKNVQLGVESGLCGGSCAIMNVAWNARNPERKTGIEKCIFCSAEEPVCKLVVSPCRRGVYAMTLEPN